MKTNISTSALIAVLAFFMLSTPAALAQENTTVPARVTVTLSAVGDKPIPTVNSSDVIVKQGNERRRVTGWQGGKGQQSGLELFILIDDASDSSLGSQLNELRNFITSQPSNTVVGVGYMRNATVNIAQNFTPDHAQAAKSLRLPLRSVGAFGSPYLSARSLMNGWPQHENRRVLVLVTDGIDRARRGSRRPGLNPDVDSTADVAQRTGTIIYGLYTPGVGHVHRNFWEANNGQNDMARLAELTGGEAFFLGFQAPVSFRPYLESVQTDLDNQYVLTFDAVPGREAGLQSISINTEVEGVEIISPNSVWIPAAK